jgi:cobalamin biosynthesis protein CobD/CbiB
MPFRYYTNLLSQASRTVAASIMVVGLLLIGFAMLIMALPELFALLAAAVFFFAGCSCAIVAIKIFVGQRRLDKHVSEDEDAYRKNVVIRRRDPYDS